MYRRWHHEHRSSAAKATGCPAPSTILRFREEKGGALETLLKGECPRSREGENASASHLLSPSPDFTSAPGPFDIVGSCAANPSTGTTETERNRPPRCRQHLNVGRYHAVVDGTRSSHIPPSGRADWPKSFSLDSWPNRRMTSAYPGRRHRRRLHGAAHPCNLTGRKAT